MEKFIHISARNNTALILSLTLGALLTSKIYSKKKPFKLFFSNSSAKFDNFEKVGNISATKVKYAPSFCKNCFKYTVNNS